MPKLPTYDSQQNINITSAPVRNQAAQPFKDQQQVLETLSNVTEKLSNANDVMQETKAKVTVETALAKQEQEAQNDPNPDNVEFHLKAVQGITKNASKGIENQEVAGKVDLELQQSAFLSGIKIQDLFKKKQMFANNQSLDALATTAAQNRANAVSPAAGQQDEDNFMQTISKNVNTGLITPERGGELVKQYKVGVVKTRISQSSSTNPDDYKGLTEGLDIKESNEVNKMIQSRIKQNVDTGIVNTFKNRVDIINGIATKKIDWQSADQIGKIAAQDPKLGTALQMVFDAKSQGEQYEPKQKDNEVYADSVANLFKASTKKEISDYLVESLKDKSMNEDRMAILVNAAQQRAENLPVSEKRDIDAKQIVVDGGMDAIQRWNKKNGNDDPQVLNDYMAGVSQGKSSSEAYNSAIKNKIVKMNPEVASLPRTPNFIIDKDSTIKYIFPRTHRKNESNADATTNK